MEWREAEGGPCGDQAVDNFQTTGGGGTDLPPPFETYGTIGCGYETQGAAWTRATHVFSVTDWTESRAQHSMTGHRMPRGTLNKYPVDLLTIDQGHRKRPPSHAQGLTREWIEEIETTKHAPKYVVESWPGASAIWRAGPLCKAETTRWEQAGYTSTGRLIRATDIGGALQQARYLIIRTKQGAKLPRWPLIHKPAHERPMSNLLTPPGLVPKRQRFANKPHAVQTVYDPHKDSMPWDDRGERTYWIKTGEEYRALRREETLSGLGKPGISSCRTSLLIRTTSVFHWEHVGGALARISDPQRETMQCLPDHSDRMVKELLRQRPSSEDGTQVEPSTFTWSPPDIYEGSTWCWKRVTNLFRAARTYTEPEKTRDLINRGIEDLTRHRNNYNDEGPNPTELQVLWWEFPPEHWDDLREGCRMNFLAVPAHRLEPNGEMDEDQRRVAIEFVDELVNLGVVSPPPPGRPILATTPLFVLPKEGQPGQWRVIANMKVGGQNAGAIGGPVYLNRPRHILHQMYKGGWSAVVDASKFFYQFRTHDRDREYLGLTHPGTGQLLWWNSLPMGATASPGYAGKFGLAVLRMLREALGPESSSPKINCWWTGMQDLGYDPEFGHGYILLGPTGEPATRVWVHVDDFLIHSPTQQQTSQALHQFLDLALDVGMLCHPKKLVPPSQQVKYTGFLFDTRGTPTLRVPPSKRERALAMVQHIRSQPDAHRWSVLALAVVAGTLESLADATPSRLGHTYLRSLYNHIHPAGAPLGKDRYYAYTILPRPVREDLEWWDVLLTQDVAYRAYPSRAATLVPTFGDGSGTGTGGTMNLPGTGLTLWMGQWSGRVASHTSNWKELKTLLLVLQQLFHGNHVNKVTGTTLFYFTDNTATYYIGASGSSASPELHKLIMQIRNYELLLECRLQVIHIPGKMMIRQGTDGLSRGIWAGAHHEPVDQQDFTAKLLGPAPPNPDHVYRCTRALGLGMKRWIQSPWRSPLARGSLLHKFTVHYPPPELAQQTIIYLLEAWVESPEDTGALVIVPRVIPAFWHGLSRHIKEIALTTASDYSPDLPTLIPIITLALTPFFPPDHRTTEGMDTRTYTPRHYRQHQSLADEMRCLPTGGTR